jgi:DNA-directed RNA polymerase specialized sigma24 family protein
MMAVAKMTAAVRTAAGIPEGGQFAVRARTESDVFLDAGTATDIVGPQSAIDLAYRFAAQQAARHLIRNRHDVEDISQVALISVLTSRKNGRVTGLTGGLIANAVTHAVAAAVAARTNVTRHEDARARTKMRTVVETFTQERGREPNTAELESIADGVRNNWHDPRHKPRKNFHEQIRTESLEGNPLHVAAAESTPARNVVESTELDMLADQLDGGEVDRKVARLQLWKAISATENLPTTRLVARRIDGAARKAMLAAGGIAFVANQYRKTGKLDAHTAALFEPFNIKTETDRQQVADYFASRGPIATKLWEAADDAARSGMMD